VALADRLADREEERQALGVALDLGHALLAVGHEVDAREPLVRLRVDDVHGAGPVVADEHDALRVRALRRPVARRREADGGQGRGEQGETQDS
jgi:hypothetical protein